MNRIETIANNTHAGEALEIQVPSLPVSCLFAGIIRAIACQAEYAQAAKFAAQRQAFYRALAAGGYAPEAGAVPGTPEGALTDRSSAELLATLSNLT